MSLHLPALTRRRGVEFNIEGNLFAPPREGYPGLIELCRQTRPAQATLVPDGDGQLTSDHGFDFARDSEKLRPLVAELRALGCRELVRRCRCARAGAGGGNRCRPGRAVHRAVCRGACRRPAAGGAAPVRRDRTTGAGGRLWRVNAGHDLSQANLGDFLANVPHVLEVSIGHALIGEALYDGLDATVRSYLDILRQYA